MQGHLGLFGLGNPNAAALSGILGLPTNQNQNQQQQQHQQHQHHVQQQQQQQQQQRALLGGQGQSLLDHAALQQLPLGHDIRQTLLQGSLPLQLQQQQQQQQQHQQQHFSPSVLAPLAAQTLQLQGPHHQKQLDLLILSRQMASPHVRARLSTHPQQARNSFIQMQLQSPTASDTYGFYSADPALSLSPPQRANTTGTGAAAGADIAGSARQDTASASMRPQSTANAPGSNTTTNNSNNTNNGAGNSANGTGDLGTNVTGGNLRGSGSASLVNGGIGPVGPLSINVGSDLSTQSSTEALFGSDGPLQSLNTTMYMTNSQINPDMKGSDWTIVDMGGMQLHTLSKSLFNYDFLTALYLNHNNLTQLPSAISNLHNLVHLDLSGNKLSTVPPELGLIFTLKELLLFDNDLSYLPFELGRLFQLEFIGLEGNPLPAMFANVIQKDGTTALIQYLRENLPIGPPPAEREWIMLTDDDTDHGEADISFTLMCYNTLGEKYATQQSYGYIPTWALDWTWRRDLLLQDILNYSADVVCLQEVDLGKFDEFFKPELSKQGDYDGIFWPKSRARTMRQPERLSVDGCSIFWKRSKFRLIDHHCAEFQQMAMQRPELRSSADAFNRMMVKDNIAVIALLEQVKTGQRFIVANAHLHWDPVFKDVKLLQTVLLMEEMQRLQKMWSSSEPEAANGSGQLPPVKLLKTVRVRVDSDEKSEEDEENTDYKIVKDADGNTFREYDLPETAASQHKGILPSILCGDFNSLPDSGVFEFLSKGELESGHSDFLSYDYGPYTKDAVKTSFVLRSAYSHVGELTFTNFTPSFKGVIDYIWYSANLLSVTGLLSDVDPEYTRRCVGFPDAHHPSDHIPLVVAIRQRPAASVVGPRPVKFN